MNPPRMFQPSCRSRAALASIFWLLAVIRLPVASAAPPDSPPSWEALAGQYEREVRESIDRYCLECHNSAAREGDLDLERFAQLDDVRADPETWQRVREQLHSGQMPPELSQQPSERQRTALIDWTDRYLKSEALARAGDPGPVVLRRLSHREYAYTIRDLTGVASLDPAREFPVDGAAGEGFTNAGAALVMSPSLLQKYLDAAKQVAEHAVLLPDRIAFSEKTTRRDWTEEKLDQIRDFYARFSVPGEGTSLSLQGVAIHSRDGGVIPLERYLRATIAERGALASGERSVAAVAAERDLNAKYLAALWQTLNRSEPSVLLDPIRRAWRAAETDDAASLVTTIEQWQQRLWRFASVGHIGKRDGPTAWQQPATPLTESQPIELTLPDQPAGDHVTAYLIAHDAGDGNSGDTVLWEQPRVVLEDDRTIGLPEIETIGGRIERLMERHLPRTADHLAALVEAHRGQIPIREIAADRDLDPAVLGRWQRLTQLAAPAVPEVTGHFRNRLIDVGGHASVRGWGKSETPNLIANRADQEIRVSTLTVPARGVTMHPSPEQDAVVSWRSPVDGTIRLRGSVADADDHCGNGIAWRVTKTTATGSQTIAQGRIANGAEETFRAADPLSVRRGDLVKLVVSAGERNHTCDTTEVALTLEQVGSDQRQWDLAGDVVDAIDQGNPLADSYGHAGTWHFGASAAQQTAPPAIAPGSTLARWRERVLEESSSGEITEAARAVQDVLTSAAADTLPPADAELRKQLRSWQGRFDWLSLALEEENTASDGPAAIRTAAPSVLEFTIPAELAAGGRLITTGKLDATAAASREGSVQLRATLAKPAADDVALTPGAIVVHPDSDARRRLSEDLEAFRQLFPAALCYIKIVPVDEVVTLRLFYREDDPLQHLMLSPQQQSRLDAMWEELRFVSREPLKMVDVFEQLWQYATQDADPSAFEPLREPIQRRAEQFRQELADAQPRHVDAVLELARRAWRRPLKQEERDQLRSLYHDLREQDLEHPAAIRRMIARVLVAPAFLYKLERPRPGEAPSSVSDVELATRLSYFLWSSAPDEQLLSVAEAGELSDPEVLRQQAQRMLGERRRVRRLAVEFGCQWLGVRDFDRLDDKSERHFPEFARLRDSMHEEAVRFFTDFFHHDRSILDLLDADHAFVDAQLAEFYGFPAEDTGGWRRVDGVRERGRGGVLAMAATLAKQSGASRTSPILRGIWVYETLLGERVPAPPADIPELPDTVPEGLTSRQLTERHSSDPACAKCHEKFDPYGFALENFDAIGRIRNAADTRTSLADGRSLEGLSGLRRYLAGERREDFVRQFCRKLLGYALGRSVQLSDQPLIDQMVAELSDHDYRVGVAIERILLSPQFQKIRGRDAADSLSLDNPPQSVAPP